MKKLILALSSLFFLTACPSQEEIRAMLEETAARKAKAARVIAAKNFSTDGLLIAQAYFFDFAERVHLMKKDETYLSGIQKLIDMTGVAQFCTTYVISPSRWRTLQKYCGTEADLRCSPEMLDYRKAYLQFLSLIGPEYSQRLAQETQCQ